MLDTIQDILDEELGKPKLKEFNPAPKSIMTNVQRMQKVMQVLQDEVRPRLAADGGDIELVDVMAIGSSSLCAAVFELQFPHGDVEGSG